MFSYDRSQGTPQKRQQFDLNRINNVISKRLLYKVLDFVNRV